MNIRLLASITMTLFALAACSSGGSSSGTAPREESPGNLAAFSSAAALETYLKDGFRASSDSQNPSYVTPVADESFATALDAQSVSAPVTTVSKTTLQEVGVDEADRVKSDGHYLYLAPIHQYPVYYDTFAETNGSGTGSDGLNSIRILALDEDPPHATDLAQIPLDHFENAATDLYLVNERAADLPDLLVAIGGTSNTSWYAWGYPWYWQNSQTEIGFFDISNPAHPQESSFLAIEGQLLASRRIGEHLYLVTRYTPSIPGYHLFPSTATELENNDALLETTPLAKLLPTIRLSDQPAAPLVTPEKTYLPPTTADSLIEPTLISITAIDLRDPSQFVTATVAGPAETVYVSTENLYVATTRHAARPLIGVLEASDNALTDIAPETTDIHKFSLEERGPVYRGSGTVVGNLGWELDKRPFRFGESQQVLRVATSLGDTWNATSTTRLTLLAETDEGRLEGTAFLDNIGETGERLYAVRYTDERAYLVTFRVTDPLYVFDLSDPYAPVMAGELHIAGYSDYLYPLGDDLLLGIGKDAIPDEGSPDFAGRGAWYQGVKLSLFDVGDPTDPQQLDALVIGKRGTESDALYNHHAITFLPASEDRPLRLALPIDLHDTPYSYDWFDPNSPSAYYDWTRTGLYLFEIGDDMIEQTGQLIVADRANGDLPDYSLSGSDRSVLVNERAYYVHDNDVWSTEWAVQKTLNSE